METAGATDLLSPHLLPSSSTGAVLLRWASPDYLETLGIPLLRGRGLSGTDRADAPKVALISQSTADRFFPAPSPFLLNYGVWMVDRMGIPSGVKRKLLAAHGGG